VNAQPARGAGDPVIGERDAFFDGAFVRTPVIDRKRLASDAVVHGPAILVQDDATTIIHPGQTARVVAFGQIDIATSPRVAAALAAGGTAAQRN
jgi:N-methylhydantoinase A